ncbi:MAG: exodeoxyribonuclease VII small subunit [Calditrichaceae bacterium]
MASKKMTFESALQRLEEIVEQAEKGEISLDESLKMFEEGSNLIKYCLKSLDAAEKKIQLLSKGDKEEFQLDLL